MDPISEFKVKCTTTMLSVAYVMNRQAAYYGRSADIDSILATITETIRSIYKDRRNENETFADARAAELQTSSLPHNFVDTYGPGYRPSGEDERSIQGVSINYQQSVAAALRNLDAAQNAPQAPVNQNVAEQPANPCNAAASQSAIPKYRKPVVPKQAPVVCPPAPVVCPHKVRSKPSQHAENHDSKCICRQQAQARNKRAAQLAEAKKVKQAEVAKQNAKQAEAATLAAAAEIAIAASRLLNVSGAGAGPNKRAQASKLPMRNQTLACRSQCPAPGPVGPIKARSACGVTKVPQPVRVAKPKAPECPIIKPKSPPKRC